jgi:hypothetical protein
MVPEGMAFGDNSPHKGRVLLGLPSDYKKRRWNALALENIEHPLGMLRVRSIIKGQANRPAALGRREQQSPSRDSCRQAAPHQLPPKRSPRCLLHNRLMTSRRDSAA